MTRTYEDRMRRVLTYIYDNPAGDLSLDTLADVAAMSRFHWRRVYLAMTGESPAQAVRRVRLHRAACWLVQTELSIDDIAKNAGLAPREAFSRAFKSAYGTSPSGFRQRGELTPLLLRKPDQEYPMYNVELDTIPAHRCAAIPHQGPYLEVGRAFEQVGAIMTAGNHWPHACGMMGFYHDDPNQVAAPELRSHAAAIVDDSFDMPDSLTEMSVAPGRIARLRFKGPYAGLKAAYDHLYGVWLPQSGEEPRDAPAMEIYINSPTDTAPDDLLTDICLPIK
ncbi:MAG: AraC family transcriptional regulator [Pseudomonadota bacterium]